MGQIHPQKKRPRRNVRPIKISDGHISVTSVLVAKEALAARNGSILNRMFTAYVSSFEPE
jgi:hypothetical protein